MDHSNNPPSIFDAIIKDKKSREEQLGYDPYDLPAGEPETVNADEEPGRDKTHVRQDSHKKKPKTRKTVSDTSGRFSRIKLRPETFARFQIMKMCASVSHGFSNTSEFVDALIDCYEQSHPDITGLTRK